MGSHPGCCNKEDLDKSIINQQIMKGFEIKIRVNFCRLIPNKQLTQEERDGSEKAAWV